MPLDGPFVARAFQNGDVAAQIGESTPPTVPGGPTATVAVGCGPFCKTTDDIVFSYANFPGFNYDAVSYGPYAQGSNLETGGFHWTAGAYDGSLDIGPLPVGAYLGSGVEYPTGAAYAVSAGFTVGPVVAVCGDGVRDPATEQCDDGNLTNGDACSSTCTITAFNVAPRTIPPGPPAPARTLGDGRHPVASSLAGFAVAYTQAQPSPTLSVSTYALTGTEPWPTQSIGGGTVLSATSNAVLAPLPDGRYAAAWTDDTSGAMGDGDGLGFALRIVDPTGATSPVMHANAETAFAQSDPDILFTGSQVVVAWMDESNPATELDVKYRLFDPTLNPLGTDVTLAGTAAAEADVALSAFAGSWAAAWRTTGDAGETINVTALDAAGAAWSVGPFPPGPAGMKPALVDLDGTHLLLVFTQGLDVGDAGVANGTKISAAVLDAGAPGGVMPFDLAMSASVTVGASRPSATRVGATAYVSWEAPGASGAPAGAHVWVKAMGWAGATLDLSKGEIPLAREAKYDVGDQERAAVCAGSVAPVGGLIAAWGDLGGNFGSDEGDVGVELVALPAGGL